MIDRDIDPVSGQPSRYAEDGYPRMYVLMPPEPRLHETPDEMVIAEVINAALDEGWGFATITVGPPERRSMVRVERALGWRDDGRLLVRVHDATAHYCPARGCRETYALAEPDWSRLLEQLTTSMYFPRGEPVLRGGRLA